MVLNSTREPPAALTALIAQWRQALDRSETHISRTISAPDTIFLSTLDAMWALGDKIGYAPDLSNPAHEHIRRTIRQAWRIDYVPVPDYSAQPAMRAVIQGQTFGTPCPDVCYGYASSAFTASETATLHSHLVKSLLPLDKEPWFPFFIIEWKSTAHADGGNLVQADTESLRDGAAAVNAMHRFSMLYNDDAPDPAKTAVSSACVDSRCMYVNLHWRRVDDSGKVWWESRIIAHSMLRDVSRMWAMRAVLKVIVEWAKRDRLSDIKAQLRHVGRCVEKFDCEQSGSGDGMEHRNEDTTDDENEDEHEAGKEDMDMDEDGNEVRGGAEDENRDEPPLPYVR